MALQHKHSLTPGAEPNLMPGQIAVNLADDILFLRAQGRVVAVDLEKWRTTAAPSAGAVPGAPLTMTTAGPFWNASLAPSSRVNGVIQLDPPPAPDAFNVPGVQFAAPAEPLDVQPNQAVLEPFYVASDTLLVSHMGLAVLNKGPGMVRVAVVDEDLNIRGSALSNNLVPGGMRTFTVAAALTRGRYYAVVWSAGALRLKAAHARVPQQGWDLDEAGAPAFLTRLRTSGDFSKGIALDASALTPDYSPEPGQPKSTLLRWTYPETD